MTLEEILLDIETRYNAGEVISTEELVSLAQTTSVDVTNGGSITVTKVVLYSGSLNGVDGGAHAEALARADAAAGSLAIIDNTDASKLIESDLYQNALLRSVGGDNLQAEYILDGEKLADGTRIPNGLRDIVSARFIDELPTTVTEAMTISPDGGANRILAQTETPHILAKGSIITYNGESVEHYTNFYESKKAALITGGLDTDSAAQQASKELNDWIKLKSIDYNTAVDSSFASKLSVLDEAAAADMGKAATFAKGLGYLGVTLTVSSYFDMQNRAEAAEASGNHEQATQIQLDWAAEQVGGNVSAFGIMWAVGSSPFMKGLAAAGVPGKFAAAFLTGLSGITAGILGGEATKLIVDNLYHSVHNLGVLIEDGIANGLLHMFGADTAQLNDLSSWYENTLLWYGVSGVSFWDPLVVDLDGDGVQTDLYDYQRVYFDIDNDGIAESMSWVQPDDGFLVYDVNGNGRIDDGTELFGNKSVNGFDALKVYDTNGDGVVNASDTIFNQLQIWVDANSNGITDTGELHTLQEYGITGFDVVNYATTGFQTGTAFTESGTIQVANVNFAISQVNTHYTKDYDLDLRVANDNAKMRELCTARFYTKQCA